MRRLFSIAFAAGFALITLTLNGISWHDNSSHDTSRILDEPPLYLLTEVPLRTKITSKFGLRKHPIFHRHILHQGVDFRARLGQDIHNVLDGIVVHAGPRGGFGNAVYVYHPVTGNTSVYAHLSKVSVALGEIVHQGQVVGKAGKTGFATGVHLHFGVKTAEGKWTDPMIFLRKVPQYQLVAIKQRSTDGAVLAFAAIANANHGKVRAARANRQEGKPTAPPIVASSPSALNSSMLHAMSQPDAIFKQMRKASERSTRILTTFVVEDNLKHGVRPN